MAQTPRRRARPLADIVGPVLGPALAAQGFTGHDIVASWPEIVGERLAAVSRPVKVDWPRRRAGESGARPEPATLQVRVEGVFALEFQHLAPVLLERINAVYGWRCVGRIVLKQGPIARARPAARRTCEPSEADRRRIIAAVAPVESEPLREALARLGRAVAAEAAGPDPSGTSLPHSS